MYRLTWHELNTIASRKRYKITRRKIKLMGRIWYINIVQIRGHERNEIWHKGSLGDADVARRTSSTRIAQRKRAIPHSTTKNNRNIIECCNNTQQGAPRTDKQTCTCASDLGDASHTTCSLYGRGGLGPTWYRTLPVVSGLRLRPSSYLWLFDFCLILLV